MLDIILQRVRDHSPHLLEPEGRLPEAAVLMPITRSEDPELVLTLRASGLSTHGGEVAFATLPRPFQILRIGEDLVTTCQSTARVSARASLVTAR